MSAAAALAKTNKDKNSSIILGAVNNNKPITIKTYYLTKSSQESLRNIVALILEKYNKSDSMDICYNSIRGLIVNATKANIKRILFKELGLDITKPNEYEVGMDLIEKQLVEKNFYKFKDELMKQDLTVKTTFTFDSEMFSITVKNNFILLPHEYQSISKQEQGANSLEYDFSKKTDENLPNGKNGNKVVYLNQYKLDQQVFSHFSNQETNESIVKLDIILKENKIEALDPDSFYHQMDHLYSDYISKVEEVIETSNIEPIKENAVGFTKDSGGLKSKGEFLNLVTRVQDLDAQLYREQQLLLAKYGENIFKSIQDKLNNARVESNEYIGQIQDKLAQARIESNSYIDKIQEKLNQARLDSDGFVNHIQKIGREEFALNKKQIEDFKAKRDREIEEQVFELIEKHRGKLLEFNSIIDKRIENQSIIIKGQLNQQLDLMNKSSLEFVDSIKQEILKIKTDIKSELQSEINIAELIKHELLNEINAEKVSLEKIVKMVTDDIRRIENFQTNKEIMDSLINQSDTAFWKMTSNIEEIKTKEESINAFMNNIDILEAAIRNTEKELKVLDHEKSEYLQEKGKMVQTIDGKIKQMEKFGEDVKQKLVEIAGFEKKLNVISGSLTDQVKKTKSIDDQLSKFSKEVNMIESKKNELSQFVSTVDQKIALMNSKTADIKTMESKFNSIETMMNDLSTRHKQITTMEDRLEDVKSTIENLLVLADEKIAQINAAAETLQATKPAKGRPKKTPPKLSGVVKDLKENILSLKKKRLSIPEIASALDIDEGMVTLILSMPS